MTHPDFNEKEQYLIASLKSGSQNPLGSSKLWGFLFAAATLVGIAAYENSTLMMLSGFVVLCGYLIYEEWSSSKWAPVWKSLIKKYESAINEDPSLDTNGEPQQADSR